MMDIDIVYNEDCIPGAQDKILDNSVDVVICDPPFGINETTFDNVYNRTKSKILGGYVESPKDYYQFTFDWLKQAKRILKQNGSIYIISGWSNLKDVLCAIDDNDLFMINHLIWKYNFGVYTKKKYVTSHYHILYLKGDKKAKPIFNSDCRYSSNDRENNRSLKYADMEDVWVINKEYAKRGEFRNQNKLPNKLVEKMIKYSTNEGDLICDFFMGNFTTAFCAKRLNRHYIGFELNYESYTHFMDKI